MGRSALQSCAKKQRSLPHPPYMGEGRRASHARRRSLPPLEPRNHKVPVTPILWVSRCCIRICSGIVGVPNRPLLPSIITPPPASGHSALPLEMLPQPPESLSQLTRKGLIKSLFYKPFLVNCKKVLPHRRRRLVHGEEGVAHAWRHVCPAWQGRDLDHVPPRAGRT